MEQLCPLASLDRFVWVMHWLITLDAQNCCAKEDKFEAKQEPNLLDQINNPDLGPLEWNTQTR